MAVQFDLGNGTNAYTSGIDEGETGLLIAGLV